MNTCLILAYNEEKFIEKNLSEINGLFDKIIVVNDGSTDNTKEKIEKLELDNLLLINNKKNLGAGKSLEIGIQHFINTNQDYLIKIDGDNQFKIEDIKVLLELTKEEYDYIKCDRFWERGIEGQIPTIRYIGNALANLMIKISTGNWKINDPLNGLFLFSKKSLENFKLPKIFNKYGYPFFINVYMNKQILDRNIKMAQIRNTVVYRDEKSKLRPSIILFKLLYYSLKCFTKKIFDKFRYSELQISALFDILFILFSINTLYSVTRLFFIYFDYINGSKASWLFTTLLMLFISFFCFSYSQSIERKIFEKKFNIL